MYNGALPSKVKGEHWVRLIWYINRRVEFLCDLTCTWQFYSGLQPRCNPVSNYAFAEKCIEVGDYDYGELYC